ncbi:MAG: MmgE/PrpD family protein [Betaproteobacteria bacterium]
MPLSPTDQLAHFISKLRYEHIPTPIINRVKDIFLDTLASALAGTHGDEVGQIRALAKALGTSEEASVIGGESLSLAGATVLNGYLITAVTVCDVHRPTLYHTTPQVIAPALAIAERDGASGKALLTALSAGLETSVRVANGIHYKAFRAKGWHSPGVVGPFGGAAAVGQLRGFNPEQQLNAFGLAGSQSAGTFAHWGTPTIKFNQSRGALSGLMAALLAEQGFLASREILTHQDGGIYNTYSDGGDIEALTFALGTQWRLEEISLRLWPAASSVQSVITALLAMAEKHQLKPDNIQSVKVSLSQGVFDMHGQLPWNDKFKALLSMPYISSVVLHDRACWLDQFEPARLNDPAVDRFARENVKVEADPHVVGTGTIVCIQTKDGRTLIDERPVARGDAADPLSRAEIEAKLHTAAKNVITPTAAQALIDKVNHLETVKDCREITQLLTVKRSLKQ